MEVSNTILNLLVKLCNIRKKLRWQIHCSQVDVEGRAIFNIFLYDISSNVLKGSIAFQQGSHQVTNFRYAGYGLESTDNVIDLLLDLINYEKSCLSV